jgi:hypothetical protein
MKNRENVYFKLLSHSISRKITNTFRFLCLNHKINNNFNFKNKRFISFQNFFYSKLDLLGSIQLNPDVNFKKL